MKEFWIRLDLSTQSANSPLRVCSLQFHGVYQVNMNRLPRLLPGGNELYPQAEKLEGVKLQAEWEYTHSDVERFAKVELTRAGHGKLEVDPGIRHPQDLIMRRVTLRCLPQG